jgi:segregation and condensation protein A
MRLVDVDVAAEYLVMAATLAHIKSRMLLPSGSEDGEDEGEDPRAELARRLAEYARFQEAAKELNARPLLRRDVFAGSVDAESVPVREGELQVSLFALLEALQRVLERAPKDAPPHQVTLERVTLQDRMLHVMDRLNANPEGAILFEDLLTDGAVSRHRVVVTFLAILELAKIRALLIFQNLSEAGAPFGPVRVRAAVLPDSAAVEAAALEAEGGSDV